MRFRQDDSTPSVAHSRMGPSCFRAIEQVTPEKTYGTQNDVCRRYKEDTCPLSSFVPSTIFSIHEVDEIKGSVGLGRTGFRIDRFYSRNLGNRLIYSLLLFLNFLEQHLCKKCMILVYSIDKI